MLPGIDLGTPELQAKRQRIDAIIRPSSSPSQQYPAYRRAAQEGSGLHVLFLQGLITHRQLRAGIGYAILRHKAHQSMGLPLNPSSLMGRLALPRPAYKTEPVYESQDIETHWRHVMAVLKNPDRRTSLVSVLDETLTGCSFNHATLPQIREALERLVRARIQEPGSRNRDRT